MRIYLYRPETGVCPGEDFADGLPMGQGRTALPPYATAIVPPPCLRGGPVLNVTENSWQIRPVRVPGTGACARPV